MLPVATDRRKTRSSELITALGLAFRSVANQFDLTHVVLSDRGGISYAGHGPSDEIEILAAFSPLLAGAAEQSAQQRIGQAIEDNVPTVANGRMSARAFEINGTRFVVSVVGRNGASRDVALCRAMSSARRILAI
jgi:hypothetical protein